MYHWFLWTLCAFLRSSWWISSYLVMTLISSVIASFLYSEMQLSRWLNQSLNWSYEVMICLELYCCLIASVTSVSRLIRLNKASQWSDRDLTQIWLRYDSTSFFFFNILFLSQHSFLSSTSCSSTLSSFHVTNTSFSSLAQSLNIT